jgi:hypothetical protein
VKRLADQAARHARSALVALVAGLLAGSAAGATVLVPMSDEALVASSDSIVVGRVGPITTAALEGGRVVTRITLAVERALKGAEAGGSLVVTEDGGRIGRSALVVFGAPEYTTGERVLAFLRRRADGSLETNGLALGKYAVAPDAGGVPLARRTVPSVDERPLAAFVGRIAALARRGGPVHDGRAGLAVAPPVLETATPAFTFLGAPPKRWFDADCGDAITFSLGNVDSGYGDAVSRAAVAQSAAAWTDVEGGSLTLLIGPDGSPAPSVVGGAGDGRNVIQFEDPFSEVQDLVGCAGVLARGGFFATFDPNSIEFSKTVGDTTFGRIVEGDVTVNQGLSQCPGLDALALAEVVAHEIGHAIGFGHSSESPGETDPVLADALMFFQIHGDGRGASVRQDDVGVMLAGYPESAVVTAPLARLSCRFDLGTFAVSCFDQQLSAAPFARFAKARAAVGKASRATTAKKQRKQLGKALAFLDKTDRAVTKSIQGECGTGMKALVADLRARATAAREGIP